MTMKRVHGWVRGRVQGVCFRYYTRRSAQALGVTGWVRNLGDGRVEFLVEGERPAVDALVDWCRNGPDSAHVVEVETRLEAYTGEFDGFAITG